MSKDDLKQYATSDHDFYALLGVSFETSESDIRRAYRKTALKYHPDKLGKDFDPEKFHILQIANDVLSDPAAKAAYDNARSARLQKQRQHDLFEGKRRQMKEDLEARERGVKRGRDEEEDAEARLQREMNRLAEDGKRRRKEMEERLKAQAEAQSKTSSPDPPPVREDTSSGQIPTTLDEEEDDEVAILERRIAEAKAAKSRQRAEKKARKSGVFSAASTETPRKDGGAEDGGKTKWDTPKTSDTPIKRPDIFKGLKADNSSASPKFSFSPSAASKTPSQTNFAATMARLKAAEKARLEDEIRRQDAEAT